LTFTEQALWLIGGWVAGSITTGVVLGLVLSARARARHHDPVGTARAAELTAGDERDVVDGVGPSAKASPPHPPKRDAQDKAVKLGSSPSRDSDEQRLVDLRADVNDLLDKMIALRRKDRIA
jgi:hypothetical protein